MHARGQNEKRRITANRLETRRVACALVIRGCRISSTVPTLRHQPWVVFSGSKTLTAKRAKNAQAREGNQGNVHARDRSEAAFPRTALAGRVAQSAAARA